MRTYRPRSPGGTGPDGLQTDRRGRPAPVRTGSADPRRPAAAHRRGSAWPWSPPSPGPSSRRRWKPSMYAAATSATKSASLPKEWNCRPQRGSVPRSICGWRQSGSRRPGTPAGRCRRTRGPARHPQRGQPERLRPRRHGAGGERGAAVLREAMPWVGAHRDRDRVRGGRRQLLQGVGPLRGLAADGRACTLTWLISSSSTTPRVEERATPPSPSIRVPCGPTSMMLVEQQAGLLGQRQPSDEVVGPLARRQPGSSNGAIS